MEQLIQSLITAETDASKIERARHGGLAYQCLKCLQRDGTRTINIKCRMEEHAMHAHLGNVEWPFYCKLCGFECRKYEELTTNLAAYSRHVVKATKEMLDNLENPMPHVFCPAGYRPLTPEASLLHFLGMADDEGTKGEGRTSSRLQLKQAAQQATRCYARAEIYTHRTSHSSADNPNGASGPEGIYPSAYATASAAGNATAMPVSVCGSRWPSPGCDSRSTFSADGAVPIYHTVNGECR